MENNNIQILYIAIMSIAYWNTVSTIIETYKSKVKHGLYFSTWISSMKCDNTQLVLNELNYEIALPEIPESYVTIVHIQWKKTRVEIEKHQLGVYSSWFHSLVYALFKLVPCLAVDNTAGRGTTFWRSPLILAPLKVVNSLHHRFNDP